MEIERPPQTTYRVTTYWKRKRSEPGLRQMGSQRLAPAQALDWVLQDFPIDSWEVEHLDGNKVQITIDWDKVKFRA